MKTLKDFLHDPYEATLYGYQPSYLDCLCLTSALFGSRVFKATWVEKAGKGIDVFKDPKTDSKKKSAKGLLRVEKEDGTFVLYDQQTKEQEQQGLLETVFLDGKLVKETSLQEIRQLVKESL